MKRVRRSRNNAEKTKQSLLTQLAKLRTEAKELGAETQVFADLENIEKAIQSARVLVKKYQDFLKVERKQLELVQATLNALKENKRKTFVADMKASIVLFLVVCVPYIIISKFYYLAHIPKHIPDSSFYIYMVSGDILFDLWVAFAVLLAIVYRYLTITYIHPFLENYPSLKIPTRLASGSTLLLVYQQVLFHSADLVPILISPSWGPSVTSVINQTIAFLNSNSIVAVTALTTLIPLGVNIIRQLGKRWNHWPGSLFWPSSLRSASRSKNG